MKHTYVPLLFILNIRNQTLSLDRACSIQLSISLFSENSLENENDLPQDELYYDEAQNTYNVVLEGTRVDDFHTLDKNSIYTLTTSAVQEIDRIQQEQASTIADLERRLALLEA